MDGHEKELKSENDKSLIMPVVIRLTIIIVPIICFIVTYKLFNRKFKREANQFVDDLFEFEKTLSYKKKDRESTVRNYYDGLLSLMSKRDFVSKNWQFMDHSTSDVFLVAFFLKTNNFYDYIEKIKKKNIREYEVDDSMIQMIDQARKRYNDDNGSYIPSYRDIWYKGKFAQYCNEIVSIINSFHEKIYHSCQNEEIRSICNEIFNINIAEKEFYDKFSSIYMRCITFIGVSTDEIDDFSDVKQFSNDLYIIDKRYFSYCLRYSQLMSKIYMLE